MKEPEGPFRQNQKHDRCDYGKCNPRQPKAPPRYTFRHWWRRYKHIFIYCSTVHLRAKTVVTLS